MSDNGAHPDQPPVIHLRRPGDAVTIVLEPEPQAEQPAQYPAELLTPARLRLTAPVDVYDAPGGTVIRQAQAGTVIDVSAVQAGWWCVYKQAGREMWIRAARLVY